MHAGIVLFNPDIRILEKSLTNLSDHDMIEQILLVDNCSDNITEIRELSSSFRKVLLVENPTNLGIASALNQICHISFYEYNNGWVLTLDDDSIITENLIDRYLLVSQHCPSNISMITCRINDRNVGDVRENNGFETEDIDYCITSGSMIKLDVWSKLGGFDDQLFIDGVDYDYCIRLKKDGYSILRLNDVSISHQIGNSKRIKFLGHNLLVLNHSENRLYYIARNYSYLGKKHNQKTKWLGNVLKRILLVLLFEKDKRTKMSSMLKGIKDARKGLMGKRQ